jgi:hypothetical protein
MADSPIAVILAKMSRLLKSNRDQEDALERKNSDDAVGFHEHDLEGKGQNNAKNDKTPTQFAEGWAQIEAARWGPALEYFDNLACLCSI